MTNEPGLDPRPSEPDLHHVEDTPRYASAADYLRVLRRQKWLIAAVTLVVLGGTILYSVTRPTTYQATAQLSFRDVLADLNLLGLGDAVPELPPAQRAALNADLITRDEVTQQVRRRLDTELSLDELQSSINARVGVQTNLVLVDAETGDAELAADIANAYAVAAKKIADEEQQDRLDQAARSINREIREVRDNPEPGVSTIRLSVLEQQLSRIETLIGVTEPVRIVKRAEAPAGPSSPNTRRDAVIGGLIGLVFGLLAAFGRDSLDRRVHTAKEVHDELGVPVLSRVGESALGYAGLASNGLPPMVEADFESFRLLRMNLAALRSDPPPSSVLVTSALPQEGKSTVSMALASAATLAGQTVLLVECDLRRPTFSRRLGVSRDPGLSDYLLGRAAPAEILQTVNLSQPTGLNGGSSAASPVFIGTLVCIAAGSPVANPAELLISPRFRGFLEKVTKAYDLVVLDSSPLLSVVDPLELVPQVDAVLVCVRVQQTTRDQVRATRAALGNVPDRPTGAVLTGLRRGGPDSYDYYDGY